jgi:hypothetical protein
VLNWFITLERLFILGICCVFRSALLDVMIPISVVFMPINGTVVSKANPKIGMRENKRINKWYISWEPACV